MSIERLEVDNLEALGAADAELGLEEVDRTRLGGDVELLQNIPRSAWISRNLESLGTYLEHPQRLVAALQEFANRRLLLAAHLVDRLERLDGTRDGSRLHDADERPAETLARFEEGGVRGDLASALGGAEGVSWVEVVNEEGLHGLVCGGQRARGQRKSSENVKGATNRQGR